MLALLSVFNIKIAFNHLISLHNLVSAWHYNAVGFVLLACTGSRDPPIEVCCGIRSGFWCNFVVGVPSFCRDFFQQPFYTDAGRITYAEEPVRFTLSVISKLVFLAPILFILPI